MVLIIIFSIIFYSTGGTLTSKYGDEVEESITTAFGIDDFRLKNASFSRGELNEIYEGDVLKGYLLVAEVAACNLGGCPAFDHINSNKSFEYFDMLLLADKNTIIKEVRVLDYFSDYGYEITSRNYLKKFKGKNICDFSRDTDGIDIVSGATISSYAIEGMISLLCIQMTDPIKHR